MPPATKRPLAHGGTGNLRAVEIEDLGREYPFELEEAVVAVQRHLLGCHGERRIEIKSGLGHGI